MEKSWQNGFKLVLLILKIRLYGQLILSGLKYPFVGLLFIGQYSYVRSFLFTFKLGYDHKIGQLFLLHQFREPVGMISTGDERRYMLVFRAHLFYGISKHGAVSGLGVLIKFQRPIHIAEYPVQIVSAGYRHLVFQAFIFDKRSAFGGGELAVIGLDVGEFAVGYLHGIKLL